MTVTIQKWGRGLGVRIPKAAAEAANLTPGTEFDIAASDGNLVLTRVDVPSLDELLKRVKRSNRPCVNEWGKPAEKEVW